MQQPFGLDIVSKSPKCARPGDYNDRRQLSEVEHAIFDKNAKKNALLGVRNGEPVKRANIIETNILSVQFFVQLI